MLKSKEVKVKVYLSSKFLQYFLSSPLFPLFQSFHLEFYYLYLFYPRLTL